LRRLAASNTLADIETVADARRPLLTYAALVLEYIIRVAKPKTIMFSTYGVREGLMYEMLSEKEQHKDGLIATAQTLNELRSRSPRHADDLIAWTDKLFRVAGLRETDEEAAASCGVLAVRRRLARASGLSRRADAQPHQRQFRRGHP
jgi:exopolyphosphatase/guanosine-5'-triphosphate,3'-diphosphate pyrophosphatase